MFAQIVSSDAFLVMFSLLLGLLVGMFAERLRSERDDHPLRHDD